MTGKHFGWHKAWRREGARLVHDSGLAVEYDDELGWMTDDTTTEAWAAWEQARANSGARHHQRPEPPLLPVAQPSRRARTPLTPSEVDSIRTLRTAGVSVNQLAKQFGVHRATIWERLADRRA